MANELKPCPFCKGEAKILRRSGTAGCVCPSKWYRERVECKVCGLTTREYKKPGAASHSWNNRHGTLIGEATTRTAEPVEGLETVEHHYWHDQTQEWLPTSFPERYRKDGFLVRELVTRSQAESIIAAESQRATNQESLKRVYERGLKRWKARADKAEADNAALTARCADWSKSYAEKCSDYEAQKRSAEALETQLAAARKALDFYGDVHKYPAPLTGGMGALWSDCGAIARAALEAKP